jgi:hypothetical protein
MLNRLFPHNSQGKLSSYIVSRNRNGIALVEFAVRTVKSVLAFLSAIDRISVATRWFVQVQLYGGS